MSLIGRRKFESHRVDVPAYEPFRVDDLPAEQFVDLAYQVILGHNADPNGLEHHAGLLKTGKKTREHLVRELTQTADFKSNHPDFEYLGEEDFVSLLYQILFGRRASGLEVSHNAEKIRKGVVNRSHLIYTLFSSQEYLNITWSTFDFWHVIHRARLVTAAQLPKASRIVDLGGSSEGTPEGALIVYGYPYTFESLSIVELPREQRHELYSEICGEYQDVIPTPQGPVNYVYSSMTDLSAFGDGSTDLVYAGQSIEHVTIDEAKQVLREVHRILKPGGFFCFDTPNRALTVLDNPDHLLVDDHKHEYTHAEMVAMLEGHGFAIREAKGMTLMDRSVREGRFIEKEAMGRDRLYDDIENCFLLYYKAQKV